ncbi:MAG: SDR family oxidoreductase [Opitutales bacterium]
MSYLDELFSLKDKTAVVIGGTGTLCGAMAKGLAGAGAEVILVGRNAESAEAKLQPIRSHSPSSYFAACDVSAPGAFEALLATVLEQSGKVDIVINGAGINSATPFFEISEEELQRLLDLNFKAVFRACQVFGKYLAERGTGGSLINIGSMSGVIPLSRVFTYSATKAAVHNLSKNLAREWAPHGVRVNTLVPGFFPAEQNRKILSEERVASIMGHTPMNRFGEADELIGATLLLASSAGSFITGHELLVDGGYACMTI